MRLWIGLEKSDGVRPIISTRFVPQTKKGANFTAYISLRYAYLINEDNPGVITPFYRPLHHHWGYRALVVGNERQSVLSCRREYHVIALVQQCTGAPVSQAID